LLGRGRASSRAHGRSITRVGWVLAGTAIACLAGSFWFALPQGHAQTQEGTGSWPMLQGGSAHLGATPVDGPRPPLRLVWRGRPEGDARMSSAVLASGVAVATGGTRLFGFSPQTGEVLWSDVRRAAGPLTPPAMDPQSGLLVFTEGSGPRDSAVVAVDLKGRNQTWRLPLEDISRGGPTIADGAIYVGSRDRFVYSIDVRLGTLRWKKRLEASVEVAPAVSGGTVFVLSENGSNGDTRLYALDAATGKTTWSYSPRGVAIGVSSPTVADETVFVGFGDAQVRAFDARSGEILWTTPVRSFFSFHSSLAYAGGSLYALDVGGGVYLLDAKTGDLRWDFQFPSFASWSSPLVAGRTVYVGMDDGTVAGIAVSSGHLLWRTRLATGPVGAFIPTGDLMLTTGNSARGALVAFQHDPSRQSLDEPSPTELDLPLAILNFAAGFLLVMGLLILLFRLVIRPRPAPELAGVSGSGAAEDDLPATDSHAPPSDD
jgi:outer membrane protein assembly factor BamB